MTIGERIKELRTSKDSSFPRIPRLSNVGATLGVTGD